MPPVQADRPRRALAAGQSSGIPGTAQTFGTAAEAALRHLIAELARQAAESGGAVDDTVPAQLETHRTKGELGAMGSLLAQRMDEAIDVSRVRGLAEGKALGVAEGKALGLAEGKEQQRTMLLRLVSRKADTAARFEALLEAVDDPGHLAVIVDHVIDSDDGDELLSRVTGAAELH